MSLVWYPSFDIQFQSTISLLHKFMFLNGASHKDFVSLTDIWPLDPEVDTPERTKVYFEREEELRNSLLSLVPCQDVVFEELPVHQWKLTSNSTNIRRIGFTKFCPECRKLGYHSVWHELACIDSCFIHGCSLSRKCETCGEELRPRLRSPNHCSNGHEILERPNDRRNFEIARSRVKTRSQQLLTWQTLAYGKSITEGILFRPTEDLPRMSLPSGELSAKDFRNRRLTDGILLSICSKLYGGDRLPALTKSGRGLRINRKVFKTNTMHLDLSGWQRHFIDSPDRYSVRKSGEFINEILAAISPRLEKNLISILDSLNRQYLADHQECEHAQVELLSAAHPIHWPILCIFGLLRTTMNRVWLRCMELDGRRLSMGGAPRFLDLKPSIALSVGHMSHLALHLQGENLSRTEVEEFMVWLFTTMLRVEVKDFMEHQFYEFESSMHSQTFHPLSLEYFFTERAWAISNCVEGIELKRIDRNRSVSFLKEESIEAASHVSDLTNYYEVEKQAYERWFSGTVKRTSKMYRKCTGDHSDSAITLLNAHKRWEPILTGRLRRHPLSFL